ncbi:lipoprotein [Pseudomonas sp. M47T1]|uniref:PA0061/PA0062 family lipoprotein n=1 Tax=unclassified Pseudomonas TaxID=196821 RepID=UPI00026087BE|nr:hypothetical protein [Pseudomonas sp. M47T1]EIK97551.1 lipoprotein [Pseudomonas sp. M47T1]
MRRALAVAVLTTLAGCSITPLPPVNPQQSWVDMTMLGGKVIMAERLDGVRLNDGRYFQVTPGRHELMVRYDFEIYAGSMFLIDPDERTCYLTVRYDGFQAGQRYRLEARTLGVNPSVRLYDQNKKVVAEDSAVNCLF